MLFGQGEAIPKQTLYSTWGAVNVHVNVTQVSMHELCVNESEGVGELGKGC